MNDRLERRRRGRAAAYVCLLLALNVTRAWAFDEDHKEKINGVMLHFRVRGDDKANPYLLILHGGPGYSAHMFYPWGPALEKNLNVIYLDQRGCGESTRYHSVSPSQTQEALREFAIVNQIKDIEGVREYLKISRWYVLGHSWGG